MTFLSCIAIGIAFLLAVALLVFAGAVLGWYVPALIERARRKDPFSDLPEESGERRNGTKIDPPGPRA